MEMRLFSGGLDESEGACCTAEMTGKPNCCEPSDKPPGAVAIWTLRRHGIVSHLPRSKSWNEFAGQSFDLVSDRASVSSQYGCM